MAADSSNVIDFPRQKLPPRGDKDLSIDTYEKVVRVRISGDVAAPAFQAWLVAEATARGLVGWARERRRDDGTTGMDAVFAGTRDAVRTMIGAFSEKGCPVPALAVTERPMRGDEPLWSGFHLLPPL